MSAKTIKRTSGWAHKHAPAVAVVEMHKLARSLDGYVFTPNGFLTGAAYELTRLAHPDAKLPRFGDLPLLDELSDRDLSVVLQ